MVPHIPVAIAVLWSQTRAAGLNHAGKITKNAKLVSGPSGLCLTAFQDFFFSFFRTQVSGLLLLLQHVML